MGSRYNFRKMKPNPFYFGRRRVVRTREDDYSSWNLYTYYWGWIRFRDRYKENFQLDLLLALAMAGIIKDDWNSVFTCVAEGKPPLQDLDRKCYKGELDSPLTYFVERLAQEGKWAVHFPPLCPEWLFPYGYSQDDYLYQLERYWLDVDDSYYRPWSQTRIGQDSPETARIRQLGQIARQEIDEVAREGGLSLRHL